MQIYEGNLCCLFRTATQAWILILKLAKRNSSAIRSLAMTNIELTTVSKDLYYTEMAFVKAQADEIIKLRKALDNCVTLRGEFGVNND